MFWLARYQFCCVFSGWLYITTQDVARGLVMQSTVVPFFWIDDTYVTGILAEHLDVSIKALNRSVRGQ